MRWAARGPRSGTEILTGVLKATVRDPSRSGPQRQTQYRVQDPKKVVGVGGQPNPTIPNKGEKFKALYRPARHPIGCAARG
jgi:hypothetical protein